MNSDFKKFIIMVLSVMLLLTAMPVAASAAESAESAPVFSDTYTEEQPEEYLQETLPKERPEISLQETVPDEFVTESIEPREPISESVIVKADDYVGAFYNDEQVGIPTEQPTEDYR